MERILYVCNLPKKKNWKFLSLNWVYFVDTKCVYLSQSLIKFKQLLIVLECPKLIHFSTVETEDRFKYTADFISQYFFAPTMRVKGHFGTETNFKWYLPKFRNSIFRPFLSSLKIYFLVPCTILFLAIGQGISSGVLLIIFRNAEDFCMWYYHVEQNRNLWRNVRYE